MLSIFFIINFFIILIFFIFHSSRPLLIIWYLAVLYFLVYMCMFFNYRLSSLYRKKIVIKIVHLFLRAYFRHLFIMKICSLINIRLYFGFQKIFIVDGFAIKSFYTVADIIPNFIVSLIIGHLQSKNTYI